MPKEKNRYISTLYNNPNLCYFFIIGAFLVAESVELVVLMLWKNQSKTTEVVIDLISASVIVIPAIYIFMLRPLVAELKSRKKVTWDMKEENQDLEIVVSARTKELEQKNQLLTKEIQDRQASARELNTSHRIQAFLNDLLQFALKNPIMDDLLEYFLIQVKRFPDLSFQDRGAVFLLAGEPPVLTLKYHRDLAPPLIEMCKEVPLGRCLCGRAAESGEVLFVDHIDHRHDNSFEGIKPHGHYCVPIFTSGDDVVGVFTVYVDEGAEHKESDESFLKSLASIFGILVQKNNIK